MPCPSCAIELANNTEKGIKPLANIITKINCGPDSGMIPIRTLIIMINHMNITFTNKSIHLPEKNGGVIIVFQEYMDQIERFEL